MNLQALRQARDTAHQELTAAKDAIDDAGPGANIAALGARFDLATDEYDRTERNLRDAQRRTTSLAGAPAAVRRAVESSRISVGREPAIYAAEDSSSSFFGDMYRHQFNADPASRERLERHGRQNTDELRARGVQQRDVGTGAFVGLTVPQYLIDLYAPLARAGAPVLASLSRTMKLPSSGMAFHVSRLTTGTATAAQAAENNAVQETDADDTDLQIDVKTYAGQQDVSRQAIERSEMVDAVIFADLISDYFTKLDAAILNGAGTSGTILGIASTPSIITKTYTDATPTLGELYPKISDAIQAVATTVYRPATTIFMHPRRWGWATSLLDSTGRPLVVPNAQGPWNALAVGEAPQYGAVVGSIQGLPVITDANIVTTNGASTNEDQIFVVRGPELMWWQEGDGNPRQFRFEQANAPQSVRLAVWGYCAFTAGRYPGAAAVISGTGLATPTF
jgi:HK97 family phage major capsid protein